MREIKKYRYVVAGILTLSVFVMGVMFSNVMDDQRYQELRNEMQANNIEMESRQLQLSYLESPDVESCSALEAGLNDIVEGYNTRLERVQRYEEDSIFNKQQFQNIQRQYVLSGLRYWMYSDRLQDKCDYNATTMLYFSENLFKNGDCDECERQGSELTLLKRQHDGDVLVFTIPRKLEDGMVEVLERQFNVTESPTIVVNGEEKVEGFNTAGELNQKFNISETG